MSAAALTGGIFSLGCAPAQELPEVPPLTATAQEAVPVDVLQQADGSIALTGTTAPAPDTDYAYTLSGGPLAGPVEGPLGAAVTLPDGRYTAVVTATHLTGLAGTSTVQFSVQDGRLAP